MNIFVIYFSCSGVECDLNINNSVGIRNTHLLRYYAASKLAQLLNHNTKVLASASAKIIPKHIIS